MDIKERGWAWVICASLLIWNIIIGGTLKLHGVLFVEYQELFNQGPTATSWISFTQGIMMMVISPIGGYMADRISHNNMRVLLIVVFVMSSACVALAGYMPSLPLTIFVFGGVLGTLIGIADPPALAFLGLYFVKLRTTAYGISFTGNSLGSLLLPLMFAVLTSSYGFRGAMLIFSAVWLHAVFLPVTAWSLSDRDKTPELQHKDDQMYADEVTFRNGPVDCESPGSSRDNVEAVCVGVADEDAKTARRSSDGGVQQDSDQPITEPQMVVPCSDQKPSNGNNRSQPLWRDILGIFWNYFDFLCTPGIPFLVLSFCFGLFGYYASYFAIPSVALEYGLTKWDTSLILTAASVSEFVFNITVGLVVDKCKISKSIILLTSYSIAGVFSFVVSFIRTPMILYAFGVVNAGIGGVVIVLAIPTMLDVVGDSKKGTASGTFPLMCGLAAALSPVVIGALYNAFGTYVHAIRAVAVAYVLGIVVYFGTRLVQKIKATRAKVQQ